MSYPIKTFQPNFILSVLAVLPEPSNLIYSECWVWAESAKFDFKINTSYCRVPRRSYGHQ